MKNETMLTHFTKGLVRNNLVFVQVLGMWTVLAMTTSVLNGLAMGAATTFVLFSAAAIASLINPIVPREVRIPVYAVIIATFVTIADLVLKAFFPPLSAALGPYVPLIVVNCMIMGRIEAFATRNPFLPSLADALGTGAGFTAALMILGAVRELLGSGEILGAVILGESYPSMLIMILPPGAFLALGILMALFNYIQERQQPILRKAG